MIKNILQLFFHIIYFDDFACYFINYLDNNSDIKKYKNLKFHIWKNKNYLKWLFLKIIFRQFIFIYISQNVLLIDIAKSISKFQFHPVLIANQKQKCCKKNHRFNIKFQLFNPTNILNKKIILIDDICTTGNTIIAARKEILNYKPKKLFIFCLYKKLSDI